MDREFDSTNELHAWADEIAIGIGFQFTRASSLVEKNVFAAYHLLRFLYIRSNN